ncbi:hypothetical protein, partial [Pseudomonas viridiflava]|uniref:hypothetical protein n=5 Tax=Pseudomonas viridiflava TaxID=33069 RepID=UPI00197B932E
HIQERTRSVLSGIPTRSVGTISVISSTPIMPMLVLSVIPESCCDQGRRERSSPGTEQHADKPFIDIAI